MLLGFPRTFVGKIIGLFPNKGVNPNPRKQKKVVRSKICPARVNRGLENRK